MTRETLGWQRLRRLSWSMGMGSLRWRWRLWHRELRTELRGPDREVIQRVRPLRVTRE